MTHLTLSEIVGTNDIKVFLLDASGVLYNDLGPIEGISETVAKLQEIGNVFVLTNNSYFNPKLISQLLRKNGIKIAAQNILSSGNGLEIDPQINAIIRNKWVYVFGTETSYEYVENAGGKLTKDIAQCDTVALCASLKDNTQVEYDKVFLFLNTRQDISIVCCNPDRYVRGKQGHKPVIGWWAEKLENELERPIKWIGKPLSNYSAMLERFLSRRLKQRPERNQIWYFDDNPENLKTMATDLGIQTCWVSETGLQSEPTKTANILKTVSPIPVSIPQLVLSEFHRPV